MRLLGFDHPAFTCSRLHLGIFGCPEKNLHFNKDSISNANVATFFFYGIKFGNPKSLVQWQKSVPPILHSSLPICMKWGCIPYIHLGQTCVYVCITNYVCRTCKKHRHKHSKTFYNQYTATPKPMSKRNDTRMLVQRYVLHMFTTVPRFGTDGGWYILLNPMKVIYELYPLICQCVFIYIQVLLGCFHIVNTCN